MDALFLRGVNYRYSSKPSFMKNSFALILLFWAISANAQMSADNYKAMEVVSMPDTIWQLYAGEEELYQLRVDTLPQIRFWRKVMVMEGDSGLLNVAKSRQILEKVNADSWNDLSDTRKESYRDSLREYYCLGMDARIFFTSGKYEFYRIQQAIPTVDQGLRLFREYGVDPWFAQAILLIESPARLKKSPVGALGSFQLMRGVATRFGLKVNQYVDERKDFERSAWAASQLLKTICIPETRKMLDRQGLAYEESDLWFRLMVLHVYHAGAANVGKALAVAKPEKGGLLLIQQLWQTEYGRFRNASQNYSQVALASLLELDALVQENCDQIYQLEEILTAASLVSK